MMTLKWKAGRTTEVLAGYACVNDDVINQRKLIVHKKQLSIACC